MFGMSPDLLKYVKNVNVTLSGVYILILHLRETQFDYYHYHSHALKRYKPDLLIRYYHQDIPNACNKEAEER